MTDDRDYAFHVNKKPGKTYVSPRIRHGLRIASKIIESDGLIHEAVIEDEVLLRRTPIRREEIVAKFIEDERKIRVLTFQRWNSEKGVPIGKAYFSFVGAEIELLLTFLKNIVHLHFPNSEKVNVADGDLRTIVTTKEQARALLSSNLDLVAQIVENDITERDVIALAYRRKQLLRFERLLNDTTYFAAESEGRGPEAVWQDFFEANPWVFGYGLSYIFMDSLEGRKLEQTVRGFNVSESGKRSDALMKTRAEVSSMCFVEIKRHDTNLLAEKSYRSGVWPASSELIGGIAQSQETVRAAVKTLTERFRPKNDQGEPTGEEIHGFEPRSYLVVGQQSEFIGEYGVNEEKYRAFEIFRRNIHRPEIITFDELLHRARFIVDHEGWMVT